MTNTTPDHDDHDHAEHDHAEHDGHDHAEHDGHDHAEHDGHDHAEHDHDHDHDAQPVTDHVHHNSWSANLERMEHADSRDLVVEQAIDAIEHTAADNHVNLVTHGAHGHPSEYLFDRLETAFDDGDLEWEYIEQCGCGGHVVRVYV